MITRRRVLFAVLALFLVGVGYVAWTLAGLPPVKYYIRWGLDPYCEPTGNKTTIEGIEFVEIGPGVFRMGSDEPDWEGDWLGRLCFRLGLPWGNQPDPSSSGPTHWVEFEHGFWIARTEVTNAQFDAFEPGRARDWASKGDRDPVVNVLRGDAQRYCDWLAGRSGRPVRLPSEAEWECVCRAGEGAADGVGTSPDVLRGRAWLFEDSGGLKARAVGTLEPNAWGFFDIEGNVWEFCADQYAEGYQGAPSDGRPRTKGGLIFGGKRCYVTRGYSYLSEASEWPGPAQRMFWEDDHMAPDQGFRPAFSNPDD